MPLRFDRRKILIAGLLLTALLGFLSFFYNLRPVSAEAEELRVFTISRGDGFKGIADRLEKERLIRSAAAFKMLALIKGKATQLKPGRYQIHSPISASKVLELLVQGSHRETKVTIMEGASVSEIDSTLAENGILPAGSLLRFSKTKSLEGMLFPDTYNFFSDSEVEVVVEKFLTNFERKAAPLLKRDEKNFKTNLILASLIQKEVPDLEDGKVVAGILKKRFTAGMALQVDATVCYAKAQKAENSGENCHPVTLLDLKIDSPYNTYLYPGWPPGPIGSPGTFALQAALEPKQSPYWFYLSDPATKKTIFAKTLEEHNQNKARYLQ